MPSRYVSIAVSLVLALGLVPGPGFGQSSSDSSHSLILADARLVNPESETVQRGALRIEGEQIVEVLEEAPADAPGRTIDLDGRWVLPGLIDAHVHSYGNRGPKGQMQLLETDGSAKVMLYSGVTSFLDLFSPENYIFELRNRQRTEGLLGADLFAAGPILTCPDGHGTQYGQTRTVTSPDDARATVDSLATRAPDVVKLVYNPHNDRFPSMERATMEAIIDAAHAHDLKTVVHIDTNWKGAAAAVQAGADALTHTPPHPLPDSLLTSMKQEGTVWIPTLAVHTEAAHLIQHPDRLENELLRAVADSTLLASYRDTSRIPSPLRSWIENQAQHQETRYRVVAKAAEAGIPILAGTDAGNPGLFQGYSLHRELQLLVEAGLSNWEALSAATVTPGHFLDAPLGLQPGDRANLLVLNASPLENIHQTQDIHRVIYRGRVVDRSSLLKNVGSTLTSLPSR